MVRTLLTAALSPRRRWVGLGHEGTGRDRTGRGEATDGRTGRGEATDGRSGYAVMVESVETKVGTAVAKVVAVGTKARVLGWWLGGSGVLCFDDSIDCYRYLGAMRLRLRIDSPYNAIYDTIAIGWGTALGTPDSMLAGGGRKAGVGRGQLFGSFASMSSTVLLAGWARGNQRFAAG